MEQPSELVMDLMAYEAGALTDEETIALFQHLINTGQVWYLQGSYQRTAWTLISAGLCHEKVSQPSIKVV